MHNIILFRGGMCGDLILGMINKDYLHSHGPTDIEDSVCNQYKIKTDRQIMKKFFRYSNKEKEEYFKKFKNTPEYTLSHDTDFCLTKKENIIQIVCSDSSKFTHFAKRFEEQHRNLVIDEAKKYIENTADTFVENYTNSLQQWQEAFKFPNTFDIKNIGKKNFITNVFDRFDVQDESWAYEIYNTWLKNNKSLPN